MEDLSAIEILLVEDNPTDAEMTLRSLKENKISNQVHQVEDGEEALDFIFGRGPYKQNETPSELSLILLDLKLPKINGLDVLETLKNDSDKKVIPVVMLTSSAEEIDVVESYKLGVNSYIVKPVDFDQFASAIKEIGFYWMVLNKTNNLK